MNGLVRAMAILGVMTLGSAGMGNAQFQPSCYDEAYDLTVPNPIEPHWYDLEVSFLNPAKACDASTAATSYAVYEHIVPEYYTWSDDVEYWGFVSPTGTVPPAGSGIATRLSVTVSEETDVTSDSELSHAVEYSTDGGATWKGLWSSIHDSDGYHKDTAPRTASVVVRAGCVADLVVRVSFAAVCEPSLRHSIYGELKIIDIRAQYITFPAGTHIAS